MDYFKLKEQDLLADCENCFALCCVALPYAKSSDFPFNKTSGDPCRNLQENFLCRIHHELRDKGFKGCTVYECFGAGQKVAQNTYKGKSWREYPDNMEEMFQVFPIMQQLHEILYYLNEAAQRTETKQIHKQLSTAIQEIDSYTKLTANEILLIDINEKRTLINPLLVRASEMVRSQFEQNANIKLSRELIGANLQNKNLSGFSFRGYILIAADLSNADLRGVDFIGADLRDTNLSGANLEESIFLTQAQLNAAKGNQKTKLPPYLQTPKHW
jgi:uncharacterized protein YjbI with pentapeptide repeats